MSSLNRFDKTDMEYSVAPSDDVIAFWVCQMSKAMEVKSCEELKQDVCVCIAGDTGEDIKTKALQKHF